MNLRLRNSLFFLLVLWFAVGFSSQALAQYQIDWMYVQKRFYEDGSTGKNRMNFGILDSEGERVTDYSDFKDAKLYDPNGNIVPLMNVTLWTDAYLYGSYQAQEGRWHYGEFGTDSGVAAFIEEDPIPGVYRLEIVENDNTTYEATYEFNQIVELPVISSHTFEVSADSQGNVHWYWDIPKELGRISIENSTQSRASISIYDQGNYIGDLYVTTPSHMGYIFIPADVVQKITDKGDEFHLIVQLRTRDNNNRSYSDPLIFK